MGKTSYGLSHPFWALPPPLRILKGFLHPSSLYPGPAAGIVSVLVEIVHFGGDRMVTNTMLFLLGGIIFLLVSLYVAALLLRR